MGSSSWDHLIPSQVDMSCLEYIMFLYSTQCDENAIAVQKIIQNDSENVFESLMSQISAILGSGID